MKKQIFKTILASSIFLALSSGNVMGEAGISVTTNGDTPDPVTANVKFKITIPKILILRVGDWGVTENTVEWDYAFGSLGFSTLSNSDATEAQWNAANGPVAQVADRDDESSVDGKLAVAIFSNTGKDLQLKATSTNFVNTSGTAGDIQPNLSEITATTTDDGAFANTATITHPTLVDSGDSAVVPLSAANGVFRSLGTWDYNYTPVANTPPVGGEYNGSVVYTLTSL